MAALDGDGLPEDERELMCAYVMKVIEQDRLPASRRRARRHKEQQA
jgi:hypothetical protein